MFELSKMFTFLFAVSVKYEYDFAIPITGTLYSGKWRQMTAEVQFRTLKSVAYTGCLLDRGFLLQSNARFVCDESFRSYKR